MSTFAFVTTRYDVWVQKDFSTFDAVYVGKAPFTSDASLGFDARLFVLNVDDVYPPLCKNMRAWRDVQMNVLPHSAATWFVRCDEDTVIARRELERVLLRLNVNPNEAVYTGRAGYGRAHDRIIKQIKFTYAMGGTCEVLNRAALARVNVTSLEKWWWCFGNRCPPRCHSDVELGRLMHWHGIEFHASENSAFRHIYPTRMVSKTAPTQGLGIADVNGLLSWDAWGQPHSKFATLHPVKDVELYNYLVDVLYGLTPVHVRYIHLLPCTHVPHFVEWFTSNCSASKDRDALTIKPPRCYKSALSMRLPQCTSAPRYTTALPMPLVYVSTQYYSDKTKRLMRRLYSTFSYPQEIASHAGRRHLRGHPLEALTFGEIGYRHNFQNAVSHAMRHNIKTLLWFDDDVLFRPDSKERWQNALRMPTCTGFLSNPGGILLLGASEWSHNVLDSAGNNTCYDAFIRTCGSFAIVVSYHVFPTVLKFLASSNRPLDHMYAYVQRRGYPVRVARPNIVVADVKHNSSVNANRKQVSVFDRHMRMGWEPPSFYN